jgi:putative endonuclease
MSLIRKQTGNKGEDLAADYLVAAGYRIVGRNYRCPFGEIDIVAEEGKTLVFVEVKSRRNDAYGSPQTAVGLEKQRNSPESPSTIFRKNVWAIVRRGSM